MMLLYLQPFLYSFLMTAGLVSLILLLCSRFEFLKSKSKSWRKNGVKKVCRIGGVAIIVGFVFALSFSSHLIISEKLWGIIIACAFIILFGVYDDFFELDWKTQLSFQIALALLVFILGVRVGYITNPLGGLLFFSLGNHILLGLAFVILWVVLMINSMNWIDGIDGVSGGVTLIGALTIFFLSLKPEVNQPPVGIIAMALAGALLGFLIFNFYPSRILAGTSGSTFMGFILAMLAIFAGTKIATALLVVSVPVIDAFWVIGERIKLGNPIFKPDNRHIHHKLMELGWPQQKIALFFYSVTLSIAIIALNTRAIGKMVTLVLVVIIMVSTLLFINKKLKK
jgi:UDP-GlcNAc:undecaprenyl-phosphate GlcNAc-1-phosphate transferase